MYNDTTLGTLAITGGVGAIQLGWWAAAIVALGIAILLAVRYRAQRKRRVTLSGN